MKKFRLVRKAKETIKIKVIVVGGFNLLRKALSESLVDNKHLDVFMHMTEIELLNTRHAEAPDVMLLLLEPSLSPLDRYMAMQNRFPDCKILIIIRQVNQQVLRELIYQGAATLLPIDAHPNEFQRAIRKVYTEGFYLNITVNAALLEEANTFSRLSASELQQLEKLKGKDPWKWF